jgi:hypothetical protein
MRKDRAMAGRGQRLAFDPVAVGRSECKAWTAYYRRDWPRFLAGALAMVRHGFSLGPFGNLKAAWHVMQANHVWAPYPDNDPEAARRHMARFYRMAIRAGRLSVDPRVAAELEVAWWHAHRAHQHDPQVSEQDVLEAVVRLYCYVYQADPADVRRAAEFRVRAMALSDAWVAAGCLMDDPTLAQERLALVASFTALAEAADRGALASGPSRSRGKQVGADCPQIARE